MLKLLQKIYPMPIGTRIRRKLVGLMRAQCERMLAIARTATNAALQPQRDRAPFLRKAAT
jgi:hypothetical protein